VSPQSTPAQKTRRCLGARYSDVVRALINSRTLMAVAVLAGTASVGAQAPEQPLPQALTQMIESERAFAARALEIGWKQAFLQYFAFDAIGFEEGKAGLAREQLSRVPDPPADLQLIWEPRFGDMAGSGDLGYLTGPVRSVRASRDNGRPRHSNYTSIWKRQRDGSFKVVMDAGIPTPGPVPFSPGFTRAPQANRFTGDYDDTTPPLGTADSLLNAEIRRDQARAYRPNLSTSARLHRPNVMPIVGDKRILQWLASQPALTAADTRFSESARSGDLGYTWGTYAMKGARGAAENGFYVRVWTRERNGQWKLALDVLQPQ
jgi:ketosteroid isomerase-like protein